MLFYSYFSSLLFRYKLTTSYKRLSENSAATCNL